MDRQNIVAYILLGCLLALYPANVGYKAIVKAIGQEIVVVDGCRYTVEDYHNYKGIEPLDAEAKTCIASHQKESDDNAVLNYKQKHGKHQVDQ